MIKTDSINTKEFFESAAFARILNDDRKNLLNKISDEISKLYKEKGFLNLNFICTHNSRRSQLGQVWSFYAAYYFDLDIRAFSGGTEVTAFHRNTVSTLRNVGFIFNIHEFSHQNPVYQVKFRESEDFLLGFSKIYDHSINKSPYVVITTCDSADENCPFIPEAMLRFHLPFVDPKSSDNTEFCEETYLKTNKEVASEVYYIFSRVKESL